VQVAADIVIAVAIDKNIVNSKSIYSVCPAPGQIRQNSKFLRFSNINPSQIFDRPLPPDNFQQSIKSLHGRVRGKLRPIAMLVLHCNLKHYLSLQAIAATTITVTGHPAGNSAILARQGFSAVAIDAAKKTAAITQYAVIIFG
jgi:hypothetical protein